MSNPYINYKISHMKMHSYFSISTKHWKDKFLDKNTHGLQSIALVASTLITKNHTFQRLNRQNLWCCSTELWKFCLMHVSAYFALGISLASNSCCLSSNIHSQFLINRINGTSRNMVIVSHQHELFGIHLFAELHHYTSHAYACIKCIRALALYIERNNFYYVIISVQKKKRNGL